MTCPLHGSILHGFGICNCRLADILAAVSLGEMSVVEALPLAAESSPRVVELEAALEACRNELLAERHKCEIAADRIEALTRTLPKSK